MAKAPRDDKESWLGRVIGFRVEKPDPVPALVQEVAEQIKRIGLQRDRLRKAGMSDEARQVQESMQTLIDACNAGQGMADKAKAAASLQGLIARVRGVEAAAFGIAEGALKDQREVAAKAAYQDALRLADQLLAQADDRILTKLPGEVPASDLARADAATRKQLQADAAEQTRQRGRFQARVEDIRKTVDGKRGAKDGEYSDAVAKLNDAILSARRVIRAVNDVKALNALVADAAARVAASPKGPEARLAAALGDKDGRTAKLQGLLEDMHMRAEANSMGLADALTPGEMGAIWVYTTVEYTNMNLQLLGLLDKKAFAAQIPALMEKTALARKALAKLPDFPGGATLRGERIWPGWEAQFAVGNTFTLKAFWSTSAGTPFDSPLQIEVEGHSGKDIAALSRYIGEGEILYLPGTKFNVVDRRDVVDRGGAIVGSRIFLEEV